MVTKKQTDKTLKTHTPSVKISTKTLSAAYERYLRIALKLPGTEVSVSYGTPSVKVKDKVLSRLRSEAEGALAIRCDFVDRERLLQADPEVFFITEHYRNYPMILVRLDKVRADALPDIVERAWRLQAPKKLIEEFENKK
jgi:hypothetical protein